MKRKIRILMCPPTYYKIPARENADMDVRVQPDMEKAWPQWTVAYNNSQRLSFLGYLTTPVEYLYEQLFMANGLWGRFNEETGRSEAVLSNFLYPIRQLEKREIRKALARLGYREEDIYELPESILFEGQGDVITLSDCYLFSFGVRSSRDAIEHIRRLLQLKKPVVPLRLVGDDFYHGDTCAFSLRYKNALIYYPGAFDGPSVDRLRGLEQETLEVSDSLAALSVCNSVYIDDVVLLNVSFEDYDAESFERSAGGRFLVKSKQDIRYEEMVDHDEGYAEVLEFMWRFGYKIIPMYTSEFKKSGAGVRCLMLFLD